MLDMATRGALILVALGGAYVVAVWFVLVVWVFRDIEARSRSVVAQVFSTLLVLLFFIPGVLLYLILRPKETLDEAFQRSLEEEYLLQDLEELPLCPSCNRYVEDDFVLCPHCRAQLREPCVNCSRLVDLRWPLCPYCATVQQGAARAAEQVETPAPRWIAPGVRRQRPGEVPLVPQLASRQNGDNVPPAAIEPGPAAAVLAGVERDATPHDQRRALPFTLVSGMRSMVRSFDRARSGGGEHEHEILGDVEERGSEGLTPFDSAESVPSGSEVPTLDGGGHNGHAVDQPPEALNGRGMSGRFGAGQTTPPEDAEPEHERPVDWASAFDAVDEPATVHALPDLLKSRSDGR
jgi:RNA polymerase subunit RPABC4/transcription elongation factor Spt4